MHRPDTDVPPLAGGMPVASQLIAKSLAWYARAEARQIFEELHGWFTKGFDTTDLKEAKALLDDMKLFS